MVKAWRFYLKHQEPLRVLGAAVIAGGVIGNVYVTRDSADAVTSTLAAKIDKISEAQAVAEFRLTSVESEVNELKLAKR